MKSKSLIHACLQGDSEAWDRLVILLSPTVWRVAYAHAASAGGVHTAEEIYQNTFLRLLADHGSLLERYDTSRGPLDRYVAVIARSCAVDYFRQRKRSPDAAAGSMRNTVSIENLINLPDRQDTENPDFWEIEAALARLGKRERDIIELLFRQGLTNQEAAHRLGLTEATIRSTKSHALHKMLSFFSNR